VDWIKCITNRLLRAARREAGFTLVEVIMATVIFVIVSTALINVVSSATAADGLARQRTIGLELAQQETEYIHQLAYPDIGTHTSGGQFGNPPGVILDTQTKLVKGLWYTLTTRIRWVNDPAPTAFVTGADYKQVRITVSRNTDNKRLARMYLYLSATGPSCGQACASIIVTTLDYALSTPLQTVAANLYDGPENAGDVTDETGMVAFAAMTASATSGGQSYYDIGTSLSGYQTLREENGPVAPGTSGVGPETAAHVQLSPSETNSTTIHLYKPVTFNVDINTSDGITPYTGTADIYIGQNLPSLRSAQHFCWGPAAPCTPNPGTGVFVATTLADDLGSESIVPGVEYTVGVIAPSGCTVGCSVVSDVTAQLGVSDGYPVTTTKNILVTLPASPNAAAQKSCTITVKNSSGTKLSGARVDIANPSGAMVPDIYLAGGLTGSTGTYTANLPVQNSYSVIARDGSSIWAPWVNTLNGSQAFNVTSSSSCAPSVTVS
jgi:prepilin-type N-terminal cleavage/methylation domain-containing protein